MVKYFFFIFLAHLFCGNNVQGNAEYDAPQEIKLYHSLDDSPNPVWLENGVVTLQNINTGNVLISQPPLNDEFWKKLKESSKSDVLYRLKSVVRTSKGKEISFYSFLKVSTLIHSGHAILIVASLDQNGAVIGIKAYPDIKRLASRHSNFNTSISFKVVEQGPSPDTASYILKLEREREAKERGATQDNRSFLAKYWMYLVPVVFFAILSGTTNGEGMSSNSR